MIINFINGTEMLPRVSSLASMICKRLEHDYLIVVVIVKFIRFFVVQIFFSAFIRSIHFSATSQTFITLDEAFCDIPYCFLYCN